MKRTSVDCYYELENDGTLSKMRLQAFYGVCFYGPLTRSELDQRLKLPYEVNPSYHKRLSELARLGVVAVVGKRPCTVTGRICEVWAATGNKPTPYVRRPKIVTCPSCAHSFPIKK